MVFRDPGGVKCSGTQTASTAGVMALSESFFFLRLLYLVIKKPLWPVFLRSSTHLGTWRDPLPGILFCCSCTRHIEGAPRLESSSVGWVISHKKEHPVWVNTQNNTKKGLHNPYNHDGVITHLESDILECEVKWALGSIAINKASGGNGIPVELFQILKDDAEKVLHSICQQTWKT